MESASEETYAMILESYDIDHDVKAAALQLLVSKIPDKSERFDGPIHHTVIKTLFISECGRLKILHKTRVLKETEVKVELDPPITVITTREMVANCNTYENYKSFKKNMMRQVIEGIKTACKEDYDSYQRAYWKAKEEHQRLIKDKSAAVAVEGDAPAPHEIGVQTEEFKQLIRDVRLKATQIELDEMMTADEIIAEKLRAYANIVSVDEVELPSIVFNVKTPSQEALEIHISDRKKFRAEQFSKFAFQRTELIINMDRLWRENRIKDSSYVGKEEVERIEVYLGFKEQDTTTTTTDCLS